MCRCTGEYSKYRVTQHVMTQGKGTDTHTQPHTFMACIVRQNSSRDLGRHITHVTQSHTISRTHTCVQHKTQKQRCHTNTPTHPPTCQDDLYPKLEGSCQQLLVCPTQDWVAALVGREHTCVLRVQQQQSCGNKVVFWVVVSG